VEIIKRATQASHADPLEVLADFLDKGISSELPASVRLIIASQDKRVSF
jgi:hypothetical protein